MYEVSQAYKDAMKSPVQHFKLRGTIINKNITHEFTEQDVLKGSFSISNQSSGSSALEIGSVYTGELNMTLLNGVVPRYFLYGATVMPYFSLLTLEGWEEIPLGAFTISEANYSASGCEITAYDNMTLLDKSFGIVEMQADMWFFLSKASEVCNIQIGMTEEYVRSLPNGNRTLGLYENNDIETWRDFISWLSQTAGCFATIDREGKLVFRRFTTNVIDTIDSEHRFTGCRFSDFVTRYTGISCVNIAEQTTSYYGALDREDDGLTMNLGSNPLLQYGVDETIEEGRRRILVALEEINYVPFSASMIGNPAYDLGDVFRFTDGLADSSKLSCMTKFDWTFNDKFTMDGVGENPALANARSKTDKDISGIIANTDENRMLYYTFTNSGSFDIGSGEKKPIINMTFATVRASQLEFKAEVLFESEANSGEDYSIVQASYNLSGEDVIGFYPTETLPDGKHILHLFYPIKTAENVVNRWTVNLSLKQGSIKIDKYQILAMISGQGLAGGDKWDGTIEVSDEAEFDLITMRPQFTSSVEVTKREDNTSDASDSMRLNLASLVGAFKEKVSASGGVNIVMVEDVINYEDISQMTYNHSYVILDNNQFVLRRNYDYYSVEGTIDEGRMCVSEVNTTNFFSTESITVIKE